ncbi:protein FAR1-RELATED SEQUENCE 11-like [Tasmannia lanceolata]|uniref:protein FAR1-RELATED SEQUENCE 11-like n=1 Tax=Tasmannia lanceolata TaxID=3420 RepID=UPI004062AA48
MSILSDDNLDLGGMDEDEILKENDLLPFIGQCFLSEEEAYIFYKNYVKRHGFSIRKGRFIAKDRELRRRDFFCNREGRQPLKIVEPFKEQRNRISSKYGCKAHLRITLGQSFDIFPEEWHVTQFIENHNHELLTPLEVRFLPANRTITKDDEDYILLLKEGGLSVRQILCVMELEKNIKHGYLSFFQKDIRNLYVKVKKNHAENDVIGLLQYCKAATEENHKFQYAFTIDEDRKLEHVFWSPAHCFDWYKKYGDVVVFDTTYKVNAYEMPFGILVGINNHGKTILFGCVLLRNETTNAFRWLMKTFISLMKKPPETILSDQDPWMTDAIAKELPFTKHSFCIWHITAKFSGWFTGILRKQYSKWCADFYKLYKLDRPEEFEHQWYEVIMKYNMHLNKHVNGLYQIKHFWVPAYLRTHFFGGMMTTGRSESINAFIKHFVSSHTNLSQFVKQVDLAIEDIEQVQMHDTMLETYRCSSLRTKSSLEEQAYDVLTPFAFKKFQEEFGRATQYSIIQENSNDFMVKHYKEINSQKHMIFWDGETTTCSLLHNGEEVHMLDKEITSDGDAILDGNDEANEDDLVYCPPISKTKDRPKKKRMRGGRELGKQIKTCGLCKHAGHNVTTCPEKENVDLSQAHGRKKNKSKDLGLNPVFNLKF